MPSNKTMIAGLVVAGLIAVFAGQNGVLADEATGAGLLKPGQGASFVMGSKQTVAYFEKTGGSCLVTIMLGEADPLKGDVYNSAARVKVSLEPGKSTNIDSAEGQSLTFKCNPNAGTMSVNRTSFGAKAARS